MVEIIQKNWEDLDIRTVAEITAIIRRDEGLGDYTIDQVEEHLKNMNERFPTEKAMLALDDDKVVGWIGIERISRNLGEIGRWHPFVKSDLGKDEIAKLLISNVREYAISTEITRIEVAFGGISEINMDAFKKRVSWYESEGWYNLEDTNFMVMNLNDWKIEDLGTELDYEIQPLMDFDNDDIFECYFKTFTTGDARWIHDMTDEQIRQEFDKNFDRSHDINKSASLAIVSDEFIIGFSFVLSRPDGEEHLEALGIHPKFRGNGLGRVLLGKSIESIQNQNAQIVSLGVDTVNFPAVKLYERFGFETTSRTARYAWKSIDLQDN